MVLTPARLAQIASWNNLADSWFIVASVTLTVCNQPQEIPRLYHYALQTRHLHQPPGEETFQRVEDTLRRFAEIKSTGKDLDWSPYDPALKDELFRTTDTIREAIMKTAALSGLPKCINSMMQLKEVTPANLRSTHPNRKPITSWDEYLAQQQRGKQYWDKVYTKISQRVQSQMESSYPDMWQYAIQDVYSPLLSFTDVLGPAETAQAVVAALVPQDVNPQLKGHLKGASKVLDLETLRETRQLALSISKWCKVVFRENVAKI